MSTRAFIKAPLYLLRTLGRLLEVSTYQCSACVPEPLCLEGTTLGISEIKFSSVIFLAYFG